MMDKILTQGVNVTFEFGWVWFRAVHPEIGVSLAEGWPLCRLLDGIGFPLDLAIEQLEAARKDGAA